MEQANIIEPSQQKKGLDISIVKIIGSIIAIIFAMAIGAIIIAFIWN